MSALQGRLGASRPATRRCRTPGALAHRSRGDRARRGIAGCGAGGQPGRNGTRRRLRATRARRRRRARGDDAAGRGASCTRTLRRGGGCAVIDRGHDRGPDAGSEVPTRAWIDPAIRSRRARRRSRSARSCRGLVARRRLGRAGGDPPAALPSARRASRRGGTRDRGAAAARRAPGRCSPPAEGCPRCRPPAGGAGGRGVCAARRDPAVPVRLDELDFLELATRCVVCLAAGSELAALDTEMGAAFTRAADAAYDAAAGQVAITVARTRYLSGASSTPTVGSTRRSQRPPGRIPWGPGASRRRCRPASHWHAARNRPLPRPPRLHLRTKAPATGRETPPGVLRGRAWRPLARGEATRAQDLLVASAADPSRTPVQSAELLYEAMRAGRAANSSLRHSRSLPSAATGRSHAPAHPMWRHEPRGRPRDAERV